MTMKRTNGKPKQFSLLVLMLVLSSFAVLLAIARAIPPITPVVVIYIVMWSAAGFEWLVGGRLFEEPGNDEPGNQI